MGWGGGGGGAGSTNSRNPLPPESARPSPLSPPQVWQLCCRVGSSANNRALLNFEYVNMYLCTIWNAINSVHAHNLECKLEVELAPQGWLGGHMIENGRHMCNVKYESPTLFPFGYEADSPI